jgi:hypothetical protein
MPNLHAHYYHGNLKAFRAELDGTGGRAGGDKTAGGGGVGSGSLGRSWTMQSAGLGKGDPNERDAFGRT